MINENKITIQKAKDYLKMQEMFTPHETSNAWKDRDGLIQCGTFLLKELEKERQLADELKTTLKEVWNKGVTAGELKDKVSKALESYRKAREK